MISIWERRLKGRQSATLGSGLVVLVITLFGLTLWSPQANAAPGDLDLAFSGDGIVTTDHGDSRAEAVAEQTDGKIVVAGNGATDQFIVARYESNGDPDTTFSGDGFTVIDFGEDSETASSVAIQSDGKIVVGGTSTTTGEFQDEDKFAVARLNADGTLDTSFSQDGKALTPVGTTAESFTVAITSDGGIVSGGRTWTVPGGYFSMALVRYEPDGDLDPGFGGGDGITITDYGLYADAYVFALAIQPNDQKIVVGGRAAGDMVVNRYLPSGMPDPTFSGDGSIRLDLSETGSTANALAIHPDGRIVAGGYASQMFALAQLTTAGEPDPQFGGGDGISVTEPPGDYRFSWINALDIDSDGRIVAGGEVGAWEPNYFYDFAVARFNPKGSFDSSFGGGDGVVIQDVGGSQGENFMRAMLIDQNGKYLLAGGSSDPDRDFALARFQGGGTAPPLERNLTVQLGGAGEGYAYIQRGLYCGNECAQSFEDGAQVTLRAYAQSGSFSGWSGACSGTGDCLLTMDSDKSVTGTFTTDAPANDNFVNAEILTGTSDTASGDTTDATHESGEPDHYIPGSSGTSSVWFSWTAPSSGTAVISTCLDASPSFNIVIAAYTGNSVDGLTKVRTGSCQMLFPAQQGTTYRIVVDSTDSGSRGIFDLTLELLDPPANDNFADAEVLTGASDTTTGDTRAASRESGEPDHSGRPGEGSVWFSWVAPASGTVVANICSGLDFDATIAAYTGSSLNSLTEVDSDSCSLVFQAQHGTAYRIAVDGWYSARGTFDLTLELSVPPANDNFADAEILAGTSDTATGDSTDASTEPGEPNHLGFGGFNSVWFSWTAPSSGTVEIDTCGSSFDTLLVVYMGSSLGSLSQVAGNDDGAECSPGSDLTFLAVSGTTYKIVIDGYGGGAYSLALLQSAEVQRTLTAAKSGTGQGTVTSSPAGIDCGADCSESYSDGSQVTLTATPQAGSTFTGWSGAGCSGTGTCQVTVNSDQTATANFTDTTAPDTTIDTGPTGTIATDQASFTFSGNPAGDTAKVQCRIDSEPFADCSSPKTFSNLADGPHTAEFRAEDAAGNQDQTPATQTFTVDTTPPDTQIDSGPTGTITTNEATFTFQGTVGDTAKIQCKLEGEAFAECTSPKTFSGLANGSHTVSFRAEDASGNQDLTPATRTFTVDTTPPDTQINTGPTGTINLNEATFTFSGDPVSDTAKIQCKIDDAAFADCTSPKTFSGLADGPHTVSFRAEDAAGNQDQSPATRTFTVDNTVPDTTPPDTTIDSGPNGTTITTNEATFTFHGTAGDTEKIMCKLDASAFADCSSPKTFTALADGSHTVSFRAQDAAGNQDQIPATRTFTVDTFLPPTPEATISKVTVSGPSKLKKGKKKTYKVKVTNSGDATATGVKLSVSGKGIKSSANAGSVAAGKTVTVKVKIKAKKPGKISTKFKVSSTNGGSKTATKKITVKK